MDETLHCIAWGLHRERPREEASLMVIGETLVIGRRAMRGDGDYSFRYTYNDLGDYAAAYAAGLRVTHSLKAEGLVMFQASQKREIEEHPNYVRRWLDGVRAGRNDESDLYKVHVRIVNGSAPLAAVRA